MEKKTGRLFKLEEALQERLDAARRPPREGMRPLRSNEMHRLLSIQNKIRWNKQLSKEDERDLKEISDIQEGRVEPIKPEQTFLHAALARNIEGRICWIHQLFAEPLRDLTPAEEALWFRVGPGSMYGYLRPDGSIQAYVLSGHDEPRDETPGEADGD